MKNTTDISRVLKSIVATTSVLIMIIALVACADGNKKQTVDKDKTTISMVGELTSDEETSLTDKESSDSTSDTTKDESTTANTIESTAETTTETPTTTVKQEETTTKKPEPTTTKQEITTTKKQETEATTTKKQETTTAKQEETTTKKEEETTTQAPIPEEPKTWFESKGYTITAQNQVADLSLTTNPTHICNTTYEFTESECTWYVPAEGYKKVLFTRIAGSCCNANYVAFDRYTGVVIDYYLSPGEDNEEGYKEIVLSVDGKEIKLYLTLSKGGYADTEILCPEDYDGIVFVWANNDDFVMKSGVEYFTKDYKLDEAYSYNTEDIYFLTVDDK